MSQHDAAGVALDVAREQGKQAGLTKPLDASKYDANPYWPGKSHERFQHWQAVAFEQGWNQGQAERKMELLGLIRDMTPEQRADIWKGI